MKKTKNMEDKNCVLLWIRFHSCFLKHGETWIFIIPANEVIVFNLKHSFQRFQNSFMYQNS